MSWQTAYALALGVPILCLSVAGLILILKEAGLFDLLPPKRGRNNESRQDKHGR